MSIRLTAFIQGNLGESVPDRTLPRHFLWESRKLYVGVFRVTTCLETGKCPGL